MDTQGKEYHLVWLYLAVGAAKVLIRKHLCLIECSNYSLIIRYIRLLGGSEISLYGFNLNTKKVDREDDQPLLRFKDE